jgi:hypothetical protein
MDVGICLLEKKSPICEASTKYVPNEIKFDFDHICILDNNNLTSFNNTQIFLTSLLEEIDVCNRSQKQQFFFSRHNKHPPP